MENTYYHVSSVTNAMRGKSLLERNGIRAYVNRAQDETGNNGCGYSIMVTSQEQKAEELLLSAGIRIRGKRKGA